MVDIVSEDGKKAGLIINERKKETFVFGKNGVCDNIKLITHAIKNVDQSLYLGSLMAWKNDVSKGGKHTNWTSSRCNCRI